MDLKPSKRAAVAVGALLVLLPLVAGADNHGRSTNVPKLYEPDAEYAVGKSDMLFDFALSPTVVRGDLDFERVEFKLDWNYFLTDHFAPGIEVFAEKFGFGGGGDIVQGGMLVTSRYYFQLDNSRVLPYGDVGLGFRATEVGPADEAFFALRFGGGLDFMLTPNVAIGSDFTYTLLAGDFTQHEIGIFPVTFSLYFGGGIDALDGIFD